MIEIEKLVYKDLNYLKLYDLKPQNLFIHNEEFLLGNFDNYAFKKVKQRRDSTPPKYENKENRE
jgi:hypothetical protein